MFHYEVANSETEEGWRSFWTSLIERGLDANAVELVVSDGSKGIPSSIKDHLPKAKLQRCVVHKVRGFEPYLLYNQLPETYPQTQEKLSNQEAKKYCRYLIERRFRYFRQRVDEIGCFPNEETTLTIFHVLMARDQAKHMLLLRAFRELPLTYTIKYM